MRSAGADVGLPLSATGATLGSSEADEKRTPNTRTTLPEPSRSASLRDTSLRSGRLTHRFQGGVRGGSHSATKPGFEETLIASCVHCEDSRSLRYDQDLGGWVCFQGCGSSSSKPLSKRRSSKKLSWKRSPLFEPWWLVDGARVKIRHSELREAYRLWAAHKDIREGRFRG